MYSFIAWLATISFWLGLFLSTLRAQARELPKSFFNNHVLISSCVPDSYEELVRQQIHKFWPRVCVRPKLSSELAMGTHINTPTWGLNLAESYVGVHWVPYLSWHGYFRLRKVFYQPQGIHWKEKRFERSTRRLFLQLGDSAQGHWRLQMGRLNAPFGLNYRPLMPLFDELFKSEDFWRSPSDSVVLVYDTQVSAMHELAYSSNHLWSDQDKMSVSSHGPQVADTVSWRSSFDVTAAGTLRLIFSGAGSQKGSRRFGAACFYEQDNQDIIVFEWVRYQLTTRRLDPGFQQVFRLTSRSRSGQDKWIIVEYEQQRRHHQAFVIEGQIFLPDYGLFHLAPTYLKDLDQGKSFLYLVSGITVRL